MRVLSFLSCFLLFWSCGTAQAQTEPNPQTMTDSEIAQVEQELGISLSEIQYVSLPMTDEQRSAVEEKTKQAIQNLGTFAIKTDESIARMVKLAVWTLNRKGYHNEARELSEQYENLYTHAVYYYAMDIHPVDLGDHAPLSQWLADWYVKLESMLSPLIMRLTKLEHIKIINYSIPVVFSPNGKNGDTWDMLEYRRHFAGTRTKLLYPLTEHDGLAGVVAYWTTWGVCMGASFGTLWVFVCSPIGELSDFAIGKWVAPPISDLVYCRSTNNGPGCVQQL